jgi:hypothetical protein
MGVADLKERWSSGGPWEATHADWVASREEALPRLHEIVNRFKRGESSAAEFRSEMDSFGKRTKVRRLSRDRRPDVPEHVG